MNFVLREEFAFLFQTFSRNDPPGKAPPSRGRSVFLKKGKRKRKKKAPLVFRVLIWKGYTVTPPLVTNVPMAGVTSKYWLCD